MTSMKTHPLRLVFAYLAVLNIIPCSAFASTSQVRVLNYYPACVEQTIDTIKSRENVRSTNNVVTRDEQAQAAYQVIEKIKERAAAVGAEAVVLTAKEFLTPAVGRSAKKNNPHHLLIFSAELLTLCADDKSLTTNITPYSENGEKQLQISIGTLVIAEKSFQLPGGTENLLAEPELDSRQINLEDGVYGLALGSSTEEVMRKFGLATSSFQFADGLQIDSYGRNHWLFFNDNQLVQVSTANPIFAKFFENYIPFRDNFDDQQWRVLDAIEKGDSKTRADQALSNKVLHHQDTQIDLHYDYGKVEGFTLKQQDFELETGLGMRFSQAQYDWLEPLLERSNAGNQGVEQVKDNALGVIRFDANTEHYVYDTHLMLTMLNQSANKIVLSESFLLDKQASPQSWSFKDFYQGQDFDEVITLVPEDAYVLNDIIEVDQDSYSMRLFFYQQNSKYQLYKIEFNLF